MAHASTYKANPPQAFMSSYAPRIRTYGNSLLTPVQPAPTQIPNVRTTKRGTTAINYAEDGYDDTDFDDLDGPRRLTGLRTRPREEAKPDNAWAGKELGKELHAPVVMQGIWREWMGSRRMAMAQRTERQLQIQNTLPLVLIPIRIDLTVHAFRPEPPLPTPNNSRDFGIDETLPAYKQPEMTTDFRLRDSFLWNLHEALMTPDHFAKTFVDEMDLPSDKKAAMALQVADQIRQQLQEYAGVAMHPLFTPNHQVTSGATATTNGTSSKAALPTTLALSREQSHTPAPGASTPIPNGIAVPSFVDNLNGIAKSGTQTPVGAATPAPQAELPSSDKITAKATPIPEEDVFNPDDAYRCIIKISINLSNRLFSDRFEWSLLHPPGFAEHFAKQTCADLGLSGEWVSAMAHAIYEAVLKLRKEACENGGIVGTAGGAVGGEIDNDTADGKEAGWRYEPEHLGDEWEPKVEILSKEEIERREWDRERELRRLRRETARFSSTATIGSGAAVETPQEDQPMGRGERSKKKRRFRSLSPLGRETPDASAGYGGGTGTLNDWERQTWRCAHCRVWGQAVWMVRDGPNGNRTLCQNCGYIFERDKRLPPWSHNLFELERPYPAR